MKTLPLFTGGLGINNKVVAHRLKYDKETGIAAFEDAKNVFIDRTGEPVARRGSSLGISGIFHSVFPGEDWGLAALDRPLPDDDTAIYKVYITQAGTMSLGGVRSGLAKGKRVDFCGVNGAVFYANGHENGMVTSEGISVPWKESGWEDENSLTGFTAPPVADHLGYNAGRIYLAIGNEIKYTEFAHLGLFDPATNGEEFPTRILVIAPAADGMYVSDEEAIYYLAGLDPSDWSSKKVADYPALEWGKFLGTVNPKLLGFGSNVPCSLLATREGPVLCLPGGQLENLVDMNVTMPSCPDTGCIGLFDETLIIQSGI